jgi:hypothetical protein
MRLTAGDKVSGATATGERRTVVGARGGRRPAGQLPIRDGGGGSRRQRAALGSPRDSTEGIRAAALKELGRGGDGGDEGAATCR